MSETNRGTTNVFIVFSHTLAGELLLKGCKLLEARPDRKIPTKTTFVFKNNDTLRQSMEELGMPLKY